MDDRLPQATDEALTVARGDRYEPFRPAVDTVAAGRVGQDLRLAREANGWTLEAVSEHLRIRLPYMQAIEDGRLADLPASAYAIGFVRAYAKALGLDQDEIARRFRAEGGEVNRKTELSFPAPVPERGVPALAVVAVGAVLVIGAYAAWYRMSGDQRPGPEAVQIVPDRLTPLVAERPVASPPPAPATPPPAIVAEDAPIAPPPDGPSVSPSQAAAAAPPPPLPQTGSRIVVRARSESWIQVKDSRGQVLLNRVLRVGESWPVPARSGPPGAQPALLMTTGNAGGTELLVDGVAAASLGTDGSVRRDLPLDADAIRDGKLAANVPPPFRVSPRNQ